MQTLNLHATMLQKLNHTWYGQTKFRIHWRR